MSELASYVAYLVQVEGEVMIRFGFFLGAAGKATDASSPWGSPGAEHDLSAVVLPYYSLVELLLS